MPVLCCFGEKQKKVCVGDKRTFRDRLPEHIKCLTVDVTCKKSDIDPRCIQSPKNRAWDYHNSD